MSERKQTVPDQPLPETDPERGLTGEEAARRKAMGLANNTAPDPGKPVWRILLENILTPFNLLNFALAACLIAVGSYRNMLFLGVVISNTVIGTVQELRARRTIQKLKLLNASHTAVIRDGAEQKVLPTELVLGDLVVLRSGDEIPADARVTDGVGAADESLLTGESDAVPKKAGDSLLSGTHLTAGRLRAVLTKVGADSYAASIAHEARKIRRPKSQLMTDLNKLVKAIGFALVPIGALLLLKQVYWQHVAAAEAVPKAVAAMIGMIPEGLMLLTSVALAVGVVRLGKRGALVQELYGIETLARTDVLCLDKTGTLTTGRMKAEAFVPLAAEESALKQSLKRFLGAFESASPTLAALEEAVGRGEEKPATVYPFSSETKKSAAAFADGMALILGAPEFVFPDDAALAERASAYAAKGWRVVTLAEGASGEGFPQAGRALGLIALSDELRPDAAETLRYFREQDVTIKVISGDNPKTVSRIAGQLGLEGAELAVDVSRLKDEELAEAAERCTVFGRVTPKRKRLLVEAIKAGGHRVAMTGDGVNDIPAMKASDCSIAMGSGTDAARRVAQLTLLDSNFASLPDVVLEGRRVVNNITRTAALFLVKTLFSLMISLLTLFLPVVYPFQPIQLTLISTLTIGLPGFVLALEKNRSRIRGSFLRTVLRKALPGAVAVTLCAVGAMILEHTGVAYEDCATLAVLAAGIFGLINLAFVCVPFTPVRAALVGAMSLAFAAAVAFAGDIFFLTVRTLTMWLWLILGAMIAGGLLVMIPLRLQMKKREEAER